MKALSKLRSPAYVAGAALFGAAVVVQPVTWADELPGAGVSVTPVYNGITEELFQHYLVLIGLEELGYDVSDPDQLQVAVAHVAVGNGDVDYYLPHWWPLHKAFWEQSGGDERLQRVGTMTRNSVQGYLIDRPTAEAHGITTIDQLADPEVAALFDVSGDGKADLYGCEPGWGCERIIEHHLDAYDLRDTVTHNQGSYFAIIADAIERVREGKPTLYYTWTPLWVSAVLRPGEEVVWLTVPFTALPEEQEGADTIAPGIGDLGFSVNDHHVIANTAFLDSNPAARRWFELLEVSIDDVNAQNLLVNEGESSDAQIRGHAERWIEENRAQWDEWIAQARQAGS